MYTETNTSNSPITFEPIFTETQIDNFEQKYNGVWGTKRRLLMLTLSRSSEELLTAFDKDDSTETMVTLMEQMQDYEEHLRAGLELVESATARLFAVSSQLGMLQATDDIHEN